MAKRLKKEVIQWVKDDAMLYATVAQTMGVKPTTLSSTLDRNGGTLNRYPVVKCIADYKGIDPEELLEEETEEAVSA